ncbi:MAG: FmdB family zinc ribbon protein [Armatimonadota bacterium]|nr:FmdB family zinc ribbon protein [Armatimonadota bacterium]
MPIYDYKCDKCGRVFELTHGFDEKPDDTCRADGCEGTLRRVFSPPTIIFKGSGWHVTDYGRGNGRAERADTEGRQEAEKAEESVEAAE